MPLFKYKALTPQGKTVNGLVEADNETFAVEILAEKGYSIISLKLSRQIDLGKYFKFLNRIKVKDLAVFARQFAVMISANVTIVQALRIFAEQSDHPRLKIIIGEVAEEVDGGMRLSDSLAKRSDVFSSFFISVIRSGETSGKLDDVLEYLAEEMEKDYDMTAKIRNAMIYPGFVLSGLLGVGTFMMIFVIPKLTDIIAQAGAQLPFATRVLIATSHFLKGYWWLLIAGIIGFVFGFKAILRYPRARYLFDYFKLRLPIFGHLFQRIYLVRFTRSMDTLISGGVTVADSLRIAQDVVSNEVYKRLIRQTIQEIEDGNSIATIFAASPLIPQMVSQMLSIGERTGKLDLVLKRVSDFYGREIDNMVANLMTLMEPIIMVLMGVGVGFMVAAIIMPMYQMANSI